MDLKYIKEKLEKVLNAENIHINELMSRHTSFKIGGPADIYVTPENLSELRSILLMCTDNNIPYFIIGNGSNLLISDKGMRGVVVEIFKKMNKVTIDGDTVEAQAGILLSSLSNKITEASLKGFEFASGIPGTLGGAIFMNAGAYGGEMKDVIISADILHKGGQLVTYNREQLSLGYRTSILQKNKGIVVSAKLKLQKGNREEIRAIINDLTKRRTEKQPLSMPSAGSAFKRPEGYYAGKLIMDSGLRGHSIGGAQVSEKHCGFIINKGNATAEDVMNLVEYIQNKVYEKFGVKMKPEIRIIGEK